MGESWLAAAPTVGVAVLLLLAPGALVMVAGWGVRRAVSVLFAPAVSVALIGASALLAPVFGLTWSVLPLALLTVIAAAVAFGIRRLRGHDPAVSDSRPLIAVITVSVLLAVAIALGQFTLAFGLPDNIAQRFDNIVHLNAVRFAIDTANASPFHIGATSDIPFYPSAWHAIAALAATLTGASVAVAVNAANLAVVSVLWVFSSVALGASLFPGRRLAVIASAAFSTGFGAFPALFFNWGVLYPNAVGYSMIPAALAALVLLLRAREPDNIPRQAVLLAVLAAGTFLAHPNAFVSFFALASSYLVGVLAVQLITRRTRRNLVLLGVGVTGTVLAGSGLWVVASTNASIWGWVPWRGPLGAFIDAVTVTPRGYGMTIVLLLAIVVGLVGVFWRPRSVPLALPFAAAIVLFVLAAGFPADNLARAWLTDPWYSDPNRLAALLPIAAIPVATLGVITVADLLLDASVSRSGLRSAQRLASGWVGTVIATIALFTVAAGPNVQSALRQVDEAYRFTTAAQLLSIEERQLLERLGDDIPSDSLVVASPRTGASLAYAYAGTAVTEMHVFGRPSDDEQFLAEHLSEIADNPEVCAAIARLGADYVLDFGDRDVSDDAAAADEYRGIQNLEPSEQLVLVDSQGEDARLFEIRGCL